MLALQNASVDQLVKDMTWSSREGAIFKEILELQSPLGNFGNLRQKQSESQNIIPFFGLYLSDMVLAEHAVKNPTDASDWTGYRKIGEMIRELQDIQFALQRHHFQSKHEDIVSSILEQHKNVSNHDDD